MTISSSSSSESHQSAAAVVPNLGGGGQSEVVFVKCDCCGLTEECTETYIAKVRERYQGRWICGLCAEAVKDEIFRSAADHETNNAESSPSSNSNRLMISTEEALNRHMNFCNKFKTLTQHPPPNPTKHLISAMKQLLRRSLSSTTTTTTTTSTIRSTPTSPNVSESCFPTLAS